MALLQRLQPKVPKPHAGVVMFQEFRVVGAAILIGSDVFRGVVDREFLEFGINPLVFHLVRPGSEGHGLAGTATGLQALEVLIELCDVGT